MKKVLKWVGISLGAITVILIIALSLMIYKVKYGFPFYDKTPPSLQLEKEVITVLLYTKANGFVHEEGIAAGTDLMAHGAEGVGVAAGCAAGGTRSASHRAYKSCFRAYKPKSTRGAC